MSEILHIILEWNLLISNFQKVAKIELFSIVFKCTWSIGRNLDVCLIFVLKTRCELAQTKRPREWGCRPPRGCHFEVWELDHINFLPTVTIRRHVKRKFVQKNFPGELFCSPRRGCYTINPSFIFFPEIDRFFKVGSTSWVREEWFIYERFFRFTPKYQTILLCFFLGSRFTRRTIKIRDIHIGIEIVERGMRSIDRYFSDPLWVCHCLRTKGRTQY